MILQSQVTVTATSIHELQVWCFVSGDVLVECRSHNASAEPFGVDRLLPGCSGRALCPQSDPSVTGRCC